MTYNSTVSLAATKDSKGIDQKPPTTIRLEYQPCSDQYQQSWGPVITAYPAELVTTGCTFDNQVNSQNDPRFSNTGLFATEYSV